MFILSPNIIPSSLIIIFSDALEATMNYGAHSKFVSDWLHKLEAEKAVPAPTATTDAPAPEPANA
jgi:peroxiredoxin Q/BCP